LIVDVAAQFMVRSPLIVEGALVIRKGTLNGNGFVTLRSSAEKTAVLSEIGEGGAYSGNLKVQHYIPYVQDQRLELSSAVSGVAVANWQTYFPITGSFAGASSGSAEPSMFIFNGTSMTPYPPAGGSNSAPIEKGKGYQAKILSTGSITLETTGIPYQGTMLIPLNGNPSGNFDSGWTFVGNPFASPIVWNDTASAFTKTGISNTIAVKENRMIDGSLVGQYHYYSSDIGDATIESGSGFWVKSISSAPALAIHEKSKGVTTQPFVPKNEVSYLKVTLKQNLKEDHTYLLFGDNFTDGLDQQFDFPKKVNEGLFNISSSINGVSAAVNALSKSFCSTAVPLIITGAPIGNYSFRFEGVSSLVEIGQVTLTDAFTNSTVAVGSEFAFSITADAASSAAGRFTLKFIRSQVDVVTPQVTGQSVCSDSPALITISNSQPGVTYMALNASQAAVSSAVEGNGESLTLEVPVNQLQAGDNPIQIRAGFAGCTPVLLQSHVTINNTQGFTIQGQDDSSICLGERAVLNVSGVPDGGSYRWYDQAGMIVAGQTGSALQTEPVQGEIAYQVSGVLSNGCESARKTIRVYADTLQVPEITLYRDTLFAQASATFQWFRNGNLIQDATASYMVPAQTGNYTVVATSSGCSKESLPFNFVLDPGCLLDTSVSDVNLETNECGPEDYILSISNTNSNVVYSVVNANDELISETKAGNDQSILISVASSSLDSGMNHIRVRADREGCINRTLDNELDINNLPALALNVSDTVKTCPGSTATVGVSGDANVVSYQWFDSSEKPIDGQTGSTFTTSPISEPTNYFVNATHVTGCSSQKEKIVIAPELISAPVIVVVDGDLTIAETNGVQWFFEGHPITDATSSTYKPSKSGNYSVKVSVGACEKESAPYLYLVTSIGGGSTEFRLDAYPIPSASRDFGIRVQSPEAKPIFIQVIDMTGRVVFKKWFEPKDLSSRLPLTGLSNGVYRVMALQGDSEVGKKIVIRN
jgi:hypothetical protein